MSLRSGYIMNDPLGLMQLKISIRDLAELKKFSTRAGEELSYRIYPSMSQNVLFLYHGIGSDSRYLCTFANTVASQNIATVVTPDFRGHGLSLKLSDSIKTDKLIQDFEELLIYIRQKIAFQKIFVGGHSMGGAFALKLLSCDIATQLNGGLLFSPFLPPSLQAHQSDYAGWISLLSDGSIQVNLPELLRTGFEKIQYSAEYIRAVLPDDEFLKNLSLPISLISGDKDQIVSFDAYKKHMSDVSSVRMHKVEGANHLSLLIFKKYIDECTNYFRQDFSL